MSRASAQIAAPRTSGASSSSRSAAAAASPESFEFPIAIITLRTNRSLPTRLIGPPANSALNDVSSRRASAASGGASRSAPPSVSLRYQRGRWLLSPHPEHRCELAVSAVIEGELQHVRIDRTFIEDGTRWLIDYKITEQLGGDPLRFVQMQVEKYRPDMQRYVRVLRAFRSASGAVRALSSAAGRFLPGRGSICVVVERASQFVSAACVKSRAQRC